MRGELSNSTSDALLRREPREIVRQIDDGRGFHGFLGWSRIAGLATRMRWRERTGVSERINDTPSSVVLPYQKLDMLDGLSSWKCWVDCILATGWSNG